MYVKVDIHFKSQDVDFAKTFTVKIIVEARLECCFIGCIKLSCTTSHAMLSISYYMLTAWKSENTD